MPCQAHHAHIMAEILAAELRPDAKVLRELMHFRFQLRIAEGMAGKIARIRQRIQPFRTGQLHGFQCCFRAGAANDNRQVIGRAGAGAECLDLLFQKRKQLWLIKHSAGLLEQEGLIR